MNNELNKLAEASNTLEDALEAAKSIENESNENGLTATCPIDKPQYSDHELDMIQDMVNKMQLENSKKRALKAQSAKVKKQKNRSKNKESRKSRKKNRK